MKEVDYTLEIRAPVHSLAAKTTTPPTVYGGNITDRVKDTWKRSLMWNYGADIGDFSITGSVKELSVYYDNWLTHDVVEISGGVATWNGLIVKLTLNFGAMPLSVDYTQMYNRVIATIGDGIGTYTTPGVNLYSQELYGVRTKYILPGVDDAAAAGYERDAFLAAHAWPVEAPTGRRWTQDEARLDVTVAGYGHTLNNYYADDSSITPYSAVSTAIDVVVDDSEYINSHSIVTNSVALYDDTELVPAGEYMDKLLRLSDAAGNLYRGYIDGYRNFYYRKIDNTPNYIVRGGKVYRSTGEQAEVSPRLLEPGIYRNLDLPLTGANRDSFFEDRRDIWVGSVWVDPDNRVRWEPKDQMVAELMLILKT